MANNKKGCEICETYSFCEPCSKCNQVVHIGDWYNCPHPPTSRRRIAQCEPTIIYRGPGGEVGFVGSTDPNCRSAKAYAAKGYNRVELPFYEARKFARQMNSRERAAAERVLEAVYNSEEDLRKAERSELRRAMQNMSPLGRALAEHAIRQGDQKDSEYYQVKDPGFHIEAVE